MNNQFGTCADNSQFEDVQERGRVRMSAQIQYSHYWLPQLFMTTIILEKQMDI